MMSKGSQKSEVRSQKRVAGRWEHLVTLSPRHLVIAAVAILLTAPAGSSWAQTQPAAATTTPALPMGHPPIPTDGAVGAPAGRMSMEQLLGAVGTQPANLTGALAVTVVSPGPGGTSTANEPVTVEFVHRGAPLKTLDLKTDGLGKLTIAGVPLMPPVDVVLSITHAGVVQRTMAPDLSLDAPTGSFEWKVYETTEQEPAWIIAMQHMIVQWGRDGNSAVVTEMFSTNNPGDRAWIGKKTAEGNRRVTFTVPLPPNADQIELGGFDDDATNLVDGKLVTASPLPPGRNEFRLTYTVAAPGGSLELPITAPRDVGNLIVFLPADDAQVKATGLIDNGTQSMGGDAGGKVRMFRAENLAAGTTATLSIKGIKPGPALAEEGAAPAKSQFSARNVAIGGGFLLVLAGAALMLMKKPQPRKE
jgi:hypothetical protein